jgi:hypothetical protein
LYSAIKHYKNIQHPTVLSAHEYFNGILASASPYDKNATRLCELNYQEEERRARRRELEAEKARLEQMMRNIDSLKMQF